MTIDASAPNSVRRAMILSPIAFAAVSLVPATASADNALLAEVDEVLNAWKTLDYSYKIITKKPDGDKAKLKLRVRMRANGKDNLQITEISAPADMRGTKVLIKSPDEMYIYLPAMKRIRRIASHMNDRDFLGTALSADDMSMTRFSGYYDATKGKREGDMQWLTLTAKGDDAPYPKIEMQVDMKQKVPVRLDKYAESGKLLRSEKRERYTCTKSGFCNPGLLKFKNHGNGLITALQLTKSKVDTDLDDKIFTKRYLVP